MLEGVDEIVGEIVAPRPCMRWRGMLASLRGLKHGRALPERVTWSFCASLSLELGLALRETIRNTKEGEVAVMVNPTSL